MKRLSILFFLLIGFAFGADAQTTVTEDAVTINITSEATRTDLLDIRNTLMEHGIYFRYNQVNWKEGHLTSINAQIADEEGNEALFQEMAFEPGSSFQIVVELTGDKSLCIGRDCE